MVGLEEEAEVYGPEKAIHFPRTAITLLGYEFSTSPADFFLSRHYDIESGWSSQILLGILIHGLQEGNRSFPTLAGVCTSFVHGQILQSLFERREIEDLLGELNHSGFVSILLSSEDGKVCGLETQLPGTGIYNVLEGRSQTTAGFLKDQGQILKESWTSTLVLSRWPYPLEDPNPVSEILGLTEEVERHFWLGDHLEQNGRFWTQSNLIGVASSWGRTLSESSNRAVITCGNIGVEGSQYRTDAGKVAGLVYGQIKCLGILET